MGEQRFETADFPLNIGGQGTHIELQEFPAAVVLAHIALSDGHAYIQPADASVEILHNHEYITGSAWLKSGDRVQVRDQVISWDVKGDQVYIRVKPHLGEPELNPPSTPPETDPDEVGTGVEHVVPLPSQPGKHRGLRKLFIALFGLLAVIALFVLFATPMAVSISPEPDSQSVSGFPPVISLGKKMLAVPGTYTVNARREGYQSLQEDFDVTAGGFQSFNFELSELPGRVQITLDPAVHFRVLVDEKELDVDPDNTISITRGLQTLSIETERYLSTDHELEIAGFGELQTLSMTLMPAWASVHVSSSPSGAQVMVDGNVLGTTPLDTEIIQGQRIFELSLTGFKPVRLDTTIMAGVPLLLDSITLEPNDGTLILTSQPTGATVTLDGAFQGSTPITMVLTSMVKHQLRLSKPGYKTTKKKLSLLADQEQQLELKLSGEYGIIFTNSQPADASLMLDGKPAGIGTQRLKLTTRQHVLVFDKPGYLPQTVKVTPRTDTSQKIEVTLKTEQQAREEARPAVLKTSSGQEMHLLQPTEPFKMGASRREAGRRANENQRLVEITKPYYLASREVTNAQYQLFDSKHKSGSAEGVSLNAGNLPVVNVSWDDAARYCNWLSKKDKLPPAYTDKDGHMVMVAKATRGYRLPSEAEWAYAARIAARTAPARYPWGEGYPPTVKAGNFADAQISDTLANVVSGYNDGYRGPAPVGSFPVQAPGFYDIGGNVAEWTNDYYAVYPGEAEKLTRDPTGPATGDHHVVRGSSWRDGSIAELRLSYRDYSRAPRDNLGFRIARYADE